nr:immunoglobulin heavy chain junction region [Homo sapiens]
CARDSASVVW